MTEDEIKALQADHAKLKGDLDLSNKKIEELTKKADPKKGGEDDPGLLEKARKEKEAADIKAAETKQIESSVAFNQGLQEFLKNNKDVLPSEIENVAKTVGSQVYETQHQKANAIRAAFVEGFFSVQDNLELLTEIQKEQFKDFLKLTVSAKQGKAEEVYQNLFEPAVGMQKKIRKAEELARAKAGFSSGSSTEDEYVKRMGKISRKNYFGEKEAD